MIAASALRPTRTRYAVLLFVYLAAFITYLDRVCLSVAAPSMQKDLGLSQVEFGWVFTVFYIAYAVFEMPTSWLGDRWGQRRMLFRIVGCWSVFYDSYWLCAQFRDAAGDADRVWSGGGRGVSDALARTVTLVPDSRAGPRERPHVDGREIRRRPRAADGRGPDRLARVAGSVCDIRRRGVGLVRRVRALVSGRSGQPFVGERG